MFSIINGLKVKTTKGLETINYYYFFLFKDKKTFECIADKVKKVIFKSLVCIPLFQNDMV